MTVLVHPACRQNQTHALTHARTDTAVGTLSHESVFAKITVTCGINPKRQHQFELRGEQHVMWVAPTCGLADVTTGKEPIPCL